MAIATNRAVSAFALFDKVNPALFESEEDRMKCLFWINHRLCSLASLADDLVYSVLALN